MLEWTEEYDRYDNTTYEAAGPYQEEDGTVFYYRIVPVLRDNKVQFSLCESVDLLGAAPRPRQGARTGEGSIQ